MYTKINAFFVVLMVFLPLIINGEKHKELERIKKYDIIQIDTSSFKSDSTISFKVYDQDYKVELYPNNDIHPGKIRHTNGNHAEINGLPQIYTHLNETCHYHGKVINHNNDDYNGQVSFAALSLCNQRGIRGSVSAFGKKLYIKPAKFYLDTTHDKQDLPHNFDDDHLVYYTSDLDTTGLPLDGGIEVDENDVDRIPDHIQNKIRRRLATYNNGVNKVEMMLVADPAYVRTWQKNKGDQWYDEMVADLADMINDVSALYAKTNWGQDANGNTIGSISVAFVEIDVIFEFNGRYAKLYPKYYSSNCEGVLDDEDCEIDGSDYLGLLKSWVQDNLNERYSEFDAAMLWSSLNFRSAGGWGYIGGVCRGSVGTSNIAALYGYAWSVRSAAHELGHNFYAVHDGESRASGCHKDDGLMGYGNNGDEFSACSIQAVEQYFLDRSDAIKCLGQSVFTTFRTNYGDGEIDTPTPKPTTPSPTPPPTNKPTNRPTTQNPTTPGQIITDKPTNPPTTPAPTDPPTDRPTADNSGTSDDWECVRMEVPVGNSDLTGIWIGGNKYEDRPYYSKGGYYLYFKSVYWLLGTELGSFNVMAYCYPQNDQLLSSCNGDWNVAGNGAWIKDSDSMAYKAICDDDDDTSDTDTSDTDTDTDTSGKDCKYFDCLNLDGLESYNGVWNAAGCYGDYGYYQMPDASWTSYLCYNSDFNLWFISGGLCDSGAVYAYCGIYTDDILQCGTNSWRTWENNGWYVHPDAIIYDCDAPFNAADTVECDVESFGFNDKLCLEGNSSLINYGSKLEMSVYNSLCANEAPIFQYIKYNSSLIKTDGFGNKDEGIEKIYYLHYNLYYKYSTDTVKSGQWIISDGEVDSNYDAVCEQESLLDCTAGKWQVLSVSNNIIQFIDDLSMTINNEACYDDADASNSNNVGVVVGLSVGAFCAIIIAGFLFYWFCWRSPLPKHTFDNTQNNGADFNTSAAHIDRTNSVDNNGENSPQTNGSAKSIEFQVEVEMNDDGVVTDQRVVTQTID